MNIPKEGIKCVARRGWYKYFCIGDIVTVFQCPFNEYNLGITVQKNGWHHDNFIGKYDFNEWLTVCDLSLEEQINNIDLT